MHTNYRDISFCNIFYINLDRSLDRRKNMEKQLHAFSLPFIRINAIDGVNLSKRQASHCNQAARTLRGYAPMTQNEIGCFLSHQAAWKKVIETGKPAFIFEDDIIFLDGIDSVINNIINLPNQPDFIKLGGIRKRYYLPIMSLSENKKLSLLLNCNSGSHAYFLSVSGAHTLLKATQIFSEAVDCFLDSFWFKQQKLFAVCPSPIALGPMAALSTISAERFSLEQQVHSHKNTKCHIYRYTLKRIRSLKKYS